MGLLLDGVGHVDTHRHRRRLPGAWCVGRAARDPGGGPRRHRPPTPARAAPHPRNDRPGLRRGVDGGSGLEEDVVRLDDDYGRSGTTKA